jgi:hypothetical protein
VSTAARNEQGVFLSHFCQPMALAAIIRFTANLGEKTATNHVSVEGKTQTLFSYTLKKCAVFYKSNH